MKKTNLALLRTSEGWGSQNDPKEILIIVCLIINKIMSTITWDHIALVRLVEPTVWKGPMCLTHSLEGVPYHCLVVVACTVVCALGLTPSIFSGFAWTLCGVLYGTTSPTKGFNNVTRIQSILRQRQAVYSLKSFNLQCVEGAYNTIIHVLWTDEMSDVS